MFLILSLVACHVIWPAQHASLVVLNSTFLNLTCSFWLLLNFNSTWNLADPRDLGGDCFTESDPRTEKGKEVRTSGNRHQKPLRPLSHQHQEEEVHREKGASEAEASLGSPTDRRAKTSWLGPNNLVIIGILPNVNSVSLNRAVNSAQSAQFRTGWTTEWNDQEGWWQKCSSYCEKCTTVGLRVTGRWTARILSDFTEGHQELSCVRQTSEKAKVHRWIKPPEQDKKMSESLLIVRFNCVTGFPVLIIQVSLCW